MSSLEICPALQRSHFQNDQSQYHNCFYTIKQYLNWLRDPPVNSPNIYIYLYISIYIPFKGALFLTAKKADLALSWVLWSCRHPRSTEAESAEADSAEAIAARQRRLPAAPLLHDTPHQVPLLRAWRPLLDSTWGI